MQRFNNIGQKDAVLRWLGFGDLRSEPHGKRPVGPSGEIRRRWRKREVDPGEAKVSEILKVLAESGLALSLDECSDSTEIAVFMDLVCERLMEAKKPSKSPSERYKFLSTLWAMDNNIGSAFIIPNKKEYTDQIIQDKWCGLYQITRNTRDKMSQEMRMAITHVSSISDRKHEKARFLNCMLTIQSGTNKKLYGYRGYLSFENFSVITWLFFQEHTLDPDMLILMTGKGGLDFKQPISGQGLTASEGPHYRPTSFKADIRLIRKFGSLDDSELMDIKSFLSGGKDGAYSRPPRPATAAGQPSTSLVKNQSFSKSIDSSLSRLAGQRAR